MNKGKYLCVNIPKLMRPVDDDKSRLSGLENNEGFKIICIN